MFNFQFFRDFILNIFPILVTGENNCVRRLQILWIILDQGINVFLELHDAVNKIEYENLFGRLGTVYKLRTRI